jgi:hypothetical protein
VKVAIPYYNLSTGVATFDYISFTFMTVKAFSIPTNDVMMTFKLVRNILSTVSPSEGI